MFLGREVMRPGLLGRLGFIDKQAMRAQSRDAFKSLGVALQDTAAPVATMSGGQRQGIAVSRAVTWASKVVFMDEPTAALGVVQTRNVLDLIARVREQGLAVVLISHNMPEVFEVADRIEVLRLGTRVARFKRGDVTMEDVVGAMTGAITNDGEARMTDVTTAPADEPELDDDGAGAPGALLAAPRRRVEHVDRPDPARADRRLQPARHELVRQHAPTRATSPPTRPCCSCWPRG